MQRFWKTCCETWASRRKVQLWETQTVPRKQEIRGKNWAEGVENKKRRIPIFLRITLLFLSVRHTLLVLFFTTMKLRMDIKWYHVETDVENEQMFNLKGDFIYFEKRGVGMPPKTGRSRVQIWTKQQNFILNYKISPQTFKIRWILCTELLH